MTRPLPIPVGLHVDGPRRIPRGIPEKDYRREAEGRMNGMTKLVTLTGVRLPRWPRSEQALVLDLSTHRTYRVVAVHAPWRSAPYTRVYSTDESGAISINQPMLAGGDNQTLTEGIADLTHRLETDTLLTEQESKEYDEALITSDIEAFLRYIQPSPRE